MTTLTVSRRTFLAAAAALPLASNAGAKARPRLEGSTFESQRGARAVELVTACLARIKALDQHGPALHSVSELNPDALSLAKALDALPKAKGALHGLPILVKENLDSADRMKTTAGSLALLDAPVPERDSTVVAKLREAGAVLLGKTNLSEWANFRSTRSSSGWSAKGGQTRNPFALDRSPSGSSSGSAVAVAASLCAAAIGTETDGSIVSPAAACGIVGLKPTLGLISRAGIIPIAHSQDTAGPMTRCVRDAAILLGAIAGKDPRDPATAAIPEVPDYTRCLDADGLKGTRLGVLKNYQGIHAHVDRAMDSVWAHLRAAGAELVDVELASTAFEAAEFEVLLYEFKADLEAYFAERKAPIRTLKDLIAFNRKHAEREMPFFGQETLERAAEKGGLEDPAYKAALQTCRKAAEAIDTLLKDRRLDALVSATGGPAWLTDPINGDNYGFSCSSPAAVAGYPHLTVPAAHVFGLPIGLSFIGTAWSEGSLLRLGYAFEQRAKALRAPTFRPHATLG